MTAITYPTANAWNIFNPLSYTENWNDSGKTSLQEAVIEGDFNLVSSLLHKGENPNAFSKDGFTALHYAAAHGHLNILKLLLECHADPYIGGGVYDALPIHLAALHKQENILNHLMYVSQLDLVDNEGANLIHWAVGAGDAFWVKKIADKLPDLMDQANMYGVTPYLFALEIGFPHVACVLKELGADVDLSQTVLDLKICASYWGISGDWYVEGIPIEDIDSGLPRLFNPIAAEGIRKFGHSHVDALLYESVWKEMAAVIEASRENLSTSAADLKHAIDSGRPVAFSTGWNNHNINVLFWSGKLFILNKGSGCQGRPIEVYDYHPKMITESFIRQFQKIRHSLKTGARGVKYYYQELPKILQATRDNDLESFFDAHQIQLQKNLNCVTTSTKLLMRCLISMYLMKYKPELSRGDSIKTGLDLYKKWSEFMKVFLFQRYLHSSSLKKITSSLASNWGFSDAVFQKWQDKDSLLTDTQETMKQLHTEYTDKNSSKGYACGSIGNFFNLMGWLKC